MKAPVVLRDLGVEGGYEVEPSRPYQGLAFRGSPDKQAVWEYLNPHRAGDDGELIASVMGALRVGTEGLAFLQD